MCPPESSTGRDGSRLVLPGLSFVPPRPAAGTAARGVATAATLPMERGVFKVERGHAYDGRVVDGTSRWMELNQRYLSAAIDVVRAYVEHAAATTEATRNTIVAADRALADATKAAAVLDD